MFGAFRWQKCVGVFLVIQRCGQVFPHQITKGHGRAQRDAAAGVVPLHHARHIVPHGEESGNGALFGIQHAGLFVGFQAAKGAERAG